MSLTPTDKKKFVQNFLKEESKSNDKLNSYLACEFKPKEYKDERYLGMKKKIDDEISNFLDIVNFQHKKLKGGKSTTSSFKTAHNSKVGVQNGIKKNRISRKSNNHFKIYNNDPPETSEKFINHNFDTVHPNQISTSESGGLESLNVLPHNRTIQSSEVINNKLPNRGVIPNYHNTNDTFNLFKAPPVRK